MESIAGVGMFTNFPNDETGIRHGPRMAARRLRVLGKNGMLPLNSYADLTEETARPGGIRILTQRNF